MQRGTEIYADLEISLLELKTDSSLGSDEKVNVWFFTESGETAGGFVFIFADPPQYKLRSCKSYRTDFPTELPTDLYKVWRISLTRTSDIRLVIHCNGVEVLNFVLLDTTCVDFPDWRDFWNKDIKQIRFHEEDTASDYYRLKGRGSCMNNIKFQPKK